MLRLCSVQDSLLEELGKELSKNQSFLSSYVNKKEFLVSDEFWYSGSSQVALSFLSRYMKGCHQSKHEVKRRLERLFRRYGIKYNIKESGLYYDDDKDCLDYYNCDTCWSHHGITIN